MRPAPTTMLIALIASSLILTATPLLSAQTLSVLHDFTGGADGAISTAGVTLDAAGHVYGTAVDGANEGQYCANGDGCGLVFQLRRSGDSWIFIPLYQFTGGNDGAAPTSRVIFGPDGALYGTTLVGGGGPCDDFSLSGCGTVFKLTPPARTCGRATCSWSETVLYRFTGGLDGAYPGYGDITFDNAGNLYGTTRGGGLYGQGTVFEITSSNGGWLENTLYAFTGFADGSTPFSGVTLDAAGNLYGTTYSGGSSGYGTVYELSSSGGGWHFELLYTFAGRSGGGNPLGGITISSNGNLYGTTAYGGGNVFELSKINGSWEFSILSNLPSQPTANLALDSTGNLYGQTVGGGQYGNGTVFKLTFSGGSWSYSDLHDFRGNDGENPYGAVIDSGGTLYGTTEYGGPNRCWQVTCGVIWNISP